MKLHLALLALLPCVSALSSESSRRDFVKSIALVTSGSAALAPAKSVLASPSPSLKLPPIGLGAWAWGDPVFWGYKQKNDGELKEVLDYAVSKHSPVLFDTAELYGLGRSETLIGEFAKSYKQEDIQVATKFAALPYRTKAGDVVKACKASLDRLQRPIDLYQIHFPNAWANDQYWDGLAQCYEQGLVKSVGVSNYGVDAIRACHSALAKRGIPLATNQIQLSLLYPYPLQNGLMQCCNDLGIEILAYSPLALGFLTGKYTRDSEPPPGPRKALYTQLLSTLDFEGLIGTMKDIAGGHEGATVAQVAINWTRAKKSIPIPGARNIRQVTSNYGALDWSLTEGEVKALDEAASKVNTFIKPDQNPFPRVDINTKLKMHRLALSAVVAKFQARNLSHEKKLFLHIGPSGDCWTGPSIFAAKHLQPDYVKSIALPVNYEGADELISTIENDHELAGRIYDTGKIPTELMDRFKNSDK